MAKRKETKGGFSPVLKFALLGGIALHLVGFLLFRIDDNPLPKVSSGGSFLEYHARDGDGLLSEFEEQADLMDSAPLFIPTRWNASYDWQALAEGRGGTSFSRFDPEIDLTAELGNGNGQKGMGELIEAPAETLASQYWNFFEGFPRAGDPPTELAETGVTVRIARLNALGSPVIEMDSPVDASLVTGFAREPARFNLRVLSDGIAGRAVLVRSSGNSEFDEAARAWLESPQVVARLPLGYLEATFFL